LIKLFTSDVRCISIPIVVSLVLDICGVRGVGGAKHIKLHYSRKPLKSDP